ncbi:MAG: hypothetical protein Q4D98_03835 [Planctomycetia bacterium]|nr:hypothetical protein [Planctomycetia bacterium]
MSDYQESPPKDRGFKYRIGILLVVFAAVAGFVVWFNIVQPPKLIKLRDETLRQWGIQNPFEKESEIIIINAEDVPEADRESDAQIAQKIEEMGLLVVKDSSTKLANVIHVTKGKASEELFKWITQLKYVNAINAEEAGVTDELCKYLETQTMVRSLSMGRNPLTSEALKSLSKMELITGMYLRECQITGENLELLANLKELKILDLSGSKFTNEDMKKIAGCKTIHWLLLNDVGIDDEGLMYLAEMPELRHLTILRGNNITPEGAKKIRSMAKNDLTVD